MKAHEPNPSVSRGFLMDPHDSHGESFAQAGTSYFVSRGIPR